MSDPDTPHDGDFQKRRAPGIEPADSRMWELPIQEPETAEPVRDSRMIWIVVGIVALIVIGLLLLWWAL
jgi:hypothetical protein